MTQRDSKPDPLSEKRDSLRRLLKVYRESKPEERSLRVRQEIAKAERENVKGAK
jgi:hypothetical protein